jgi:hypothetical protein
MEITKLFDNILDLPGIEGVCLFDTRGRMYVNRLPSFLSDELFADAQRRIVAMYETMDENFLPCDDYLLKFSERWLLLRRNEGALLLVLGGEKANLASTRMVTNMTLKHLTPEVLAQLGVGDAARAVPLAATPTVAAAGSGSTELASVPSAASAPAATTKPKSSGLSFFGFTSLGRAKEGEPSAAAAAETAPALAAAGEESSTPSSAEPARPVRMYRGRAY